MTMPIDGNTAAYVLHTRPAFEDLRQVASQVAGLLVLAASGASTAAPDHPLLTLARELHQHASDALHSASVPAPAREHHAGMLLAAGALHESLQCAAAGLLAFDRILIPLRRAYNHLERASRTLPGYEMVSFEHACCS
jgi:hypothetical protein